MRRVRLSPILSLLLQAVLDASLSTRLLKDPLNYLPAFDHALKEVVMSVHDPAKHTNVETTIYYIALRGSFGDHHVNPRTLRAAMLGKMTCIEGIVTRCELSIGSFTKSEPSADERGLTQATSDRKSVV